MYQKKEKKFLQKMSSHLSQINVVMAHRNYFRQDYLQILKLATHRKSAKNGPMFIFYFCLNKASSFMDM